MRMFRALYLANAREFLRDKVALIISSIMPLVFAGFFGLIFGGSNEAFRLNVGLVLLDTGPGGQQAATLLRRPEMQQVMNLHEGELEPLLADLRAGRVEVVLVVPTDFSQRLAAKEQVALPVYYDQVRGTSADTAMGFMRTLIGEANLSLSGAPAPLSMEARPVLSQQFRAFDFYVPNMLAMSLFWLGIFGTAQTLVDMREKQVLRRLAVTPVSRRTVLAAQVGWRVTVGLGQALIFMLMGWLVLGMGLPKNLLLFPLATILGALVFVTLGYFTAAVSPTTESSVAIAQIWNFGLMFFSGIFFQREMLPKFLRPLLNLSPLTYLADALRQVMSGFPAQYPLYVDFVVLGGFLIVLLVLTVRFWRWE